MPGSSARRMGTHLNVTDTLQSAECTPDLGGLWRAQCPVGRCRPGPVLPRRLQTPCRGSEFPHPLMGTGFLVLTPTVTSRYLGLLERLGGQPMVASPLIGLTQAIPCHGRIQAQPQAREDTEGMTQVLDGLAEQPCRALSQTDATQG